MLQFNYMLKAEPRTEFGKGNAKKLRERGHVPAVVYSRSKKGESYSVSLLLSEVNRLVADYQAKSRMVEISLEGKTEKVVLKEVSFNPVTDDPEHIDLLEVSEGDKIVASLPVRVVNTDKSVGIKRGGDIFILHYNVPIEITVTEEPAEVLIDATGSVIGQKFRLSDAVLPPKGKLVKDMLIAKVVGRKSGGPQTSEAAATPSAK